MNDSNGELLRHLADDSGELPTDANTAIADVIAQGRSRLLRRRAGLMAGAVVAVAIVLPVSLAGGSSGQAPSLSAGAHHMRSQVSAPQQPNIMAPGSPSAPPPAVAAAQQAQQSAFFSAISALGGASGGLLLNATATTMHLQVGGEVTLNGNTGLVRITVYSDTSAFNVSDPCSSLQGSSEWAPPTCQETVEADGSHTWSYELTSTLGDGEVVVNAVNFRTNGQAVFVQADNTNSAGGSVGDTALDQSEANNLSLLPAFVFPG